jgi:class 3 adenylate cyclase
MSDAARKRDFFITHTAADRPWAEWLDWELRRAGYTTIVQACDTEQGGKAAARTGGNTLATRSVVPVFSQAFLRSGFTPEEFAALFSPDLQTRRGWILPVLVEPDVDLGKYETPASIRLAGLNEVEARARLLDGVRDAMSRDPDRPQGRGDPAVAAERRPPPHEREARDADESAELQNDTPAWPPGAPASADDSPFPQEGAAGRRRILISCTPDTLELARSLAGALPDRDFQPLIRHGINPVSARPESASGNAREVFACDHLVLVPGHSSAFTPDSRFGMEWAIFTSEQDAGMKSGRCVVVLPPEVPAGSLPASLQQAARMDHSSPAARLAELLERAAPKRAAVPDSTWVTSSGLLLLADVKDSTILARAPGPAFNAALITWFKEQFAAAAAAHGFLYIKSTGDGALLFLPFSSGREPGTALAGLARHLFITPGLPPVMSVRPILRLVASIVACQLRPTGPDAYDEIAGNDVNLLFRLEKFSGASELAITPGLDFLVRPRIRQEEFAFQRREHEGRLKGMEDLGDRHVLHHLVPVLTTAPTAADLPAALLTRLSILRQDVQHIPLFGSRELSVPMEKNFISLELETREEGVGSAASVRRVQHGAAAQPLSPADLFARYRCGVIMGLPGAGKTTILRHFAWLGFTREHRVLVLFVPGRDLRRWHTDYAESDAAESTDHLNSLWRFLAAAVLFGAEEGRFLAQGARADADTAAALFQRAWQAGQLMVLVDALDEILDPGVKQAITAWGRNLCESLAAIPPATDPAAPRGCRFYMSARLTEIERSMLPRPGFLVRRLGLAQH